MIDLPASWTGGIDDLVWEANRWLSLLLPEDRAQRLKEEVNPRLVRHYTTQGLLPAAGREGRDARYGRSHLLALLALRRLMADGLSGKALYAALQGKTEEEWQQLAEQGLASVEGLVARSEEDLRRQNTLNYLQNLKKPTEATLRSMPAPALPSAPLPAAVRSGRKKPGQGRGRKLTALELRPGLEIMVAETFRLPEDESEWEGLFAELRLALVDLS